mmetsp:Transcript_73364/g.137102  ORF Transcript_73364/g.137102 Transcript_73364/m.137102 type:complete len:178 (+) Transcript_73364:182-715(+)
MSGEGDGMKDRASEPQQLEEQVRNTINALKPMAAALERLPSSLPVGQKNMFLFSVVGEHFVDYYEVSHPDATVPDDKAELILGSNPYDWIREFRRNVVGKFPAKALRKLCAICVLSASEPRAEPFKAKWIEGSPVPSELTVYFDEIAKTQAAVDALVPDDAFEAARVPFVPSHSSGR